MKEVAARTYFALCLALGRLLRSARYSAPPIVSEGEDRVRKHRRFYAPLLVWLGGPLVRILGTGVRVLPQREWEERERLIYQTLHGASIRIDPDGVLVLPHLAGQTLATLLDDPALDQPARKTAIASAVVALAGFHRLGFTHGDAMAENVLIEVARPGSPGRGTCVANWFDFETVHDSARPVVWQRADDVRALLVTSLIRTVPEQRADMLGFVLDAYADVDVACVLATSLTSVWRRSLLFHLAQAPLSFEWFAEMGRLLRARGV